MSGSLKNPFLQSNLSIKLLAKDTAFYGVISGLTRLSTFILVPLLTYSLSQTEFAVVDTLLMFSTAGLVLGNAGMDAALMFHYFHVPESQRNTYVATGLWIRLLLGVLAMLIGISLANPIDNLVFGTQNLSFWTILAFLPVPFALVVSYCLDILRIEHERWWFMSLSLVRITLLIGGTWWILYLSGENSVETFLLFRVFPEFVVAAGLILLTARRHRLFIFGAKAARELLRYGAPFIPATFMLWGLTFVDRWYLFQSVDSSQVGVYALAVKIGMVLTLFTAAIQMAFNPFSMAVKEDERSGAFYARAFALTMFTGVAAVVMICANLPWIVGLIGGSDHYAGALVPAMILLVGNLFHTAFVFVSTGANIKQKTMFHVYAFSFALLTTVMLLMLLVPPWGIVGAALAVCCGYIILAATTLVLSHRVLPIKFNIFQVGLGILLGIAVSIGSTTQLTSGDVTSIVLHNVIGLLIIPVLFRIMVRKGEVDKLLEYIRPTVVK